MVFSIYSIWRILCQLMASKKIKYFINVPLCTVTAKRKLKKNIYHDNRLQKGGLCFLMHLSTLSSSIKIQLQIKQDIPNEFMLRHLKLGIRSDHWILLSQCIGSFSLVTKCPALLLCASDKHWTKRNLWMKEVYLAYTSQSHLIEGCLGRNSCIAEL